MEHKLIELCTQVQAGDIAKKDLPTMSTSSDYVRSNAFAYYVLLNTWLLIWKHNAPLSWIRIFSLICDKGLVAVIRLLQDEVTLLLADHVLGPWSQIILCDLRKEYGSVDIDSVTPDELVTLLQILRYPKRFSPTKADLVHKQTLDDFLSWENRTKMIQRSNSWYYTYITKELRAEISEMYNWTAIVDRVRAVKADPQSWMLSSGAASNAKATTAAKVTHLIYTIPGYQLPIFGQYTHSRPMSCQMGLSDLDIVKIQAVPKSYKSARIIGMDDVARNAMGKAIEQEFRQQDRVRGTIDLEDQTINQRLAAQGAIDGSIATLDASKASDSISKSLFVDIFPREYVTEVLPLLPTHFELMGKKNKCYALQMASTSGHSLTFRHETIVFLAAMRLAYRQYVALVEHKQVAKVSQQSAWAYGDDSLVASEAAEIAVHILATIGININTDKSYWSGPYRESCGKEYWKGTDVTSEYFPRFPVLGSWAGNRVLLQASTYRDEYRGKIDNSLTLLIDLQKKLFHLDYDAARLVASIVKAAYPKMTSSVAGTVCNDLWDVCDSNITRPVRGYKIETCAGKYRFLDTKRWVSIDPMTGFSGSNLDTFNRLHSLDTLHCQAVEVYYPAQGTCPETYRRTWEYWKYITFLQSGPRYASDLDRLLGITQAPVSLQEFIGVKRLELRVK
jgi:hypothetical protein